MSGTATLNAPLSGPTLVDIIDRQTRRQIHLIALISVFFLGTYSRLICPFIDDLPLSTLLVELLAIFAFQVATREYLHRVWAVPPLGRSVARHGYIVSLATWGLTGAFAMGFNAAVHEFPIGSHFKIATGYWLLGAGLLSQWEYTLLEESSRRQSVRYVNAEAYLDRISRRVVEGYGLFTLAPTIALLMLIIRYEFEGYLDSRVLVEVFSLGAFCVATAILVAVRFGNSLHRDARSLVEGTQRVQKGERDIVLDSSRLDEIGELAANINAMCDELRQQQAALEARVSELTAMSGVSSAISSTLSVDRILDLVMEHSKQLSSAEACSLLLLDDDGEHLSFQVLKGDKDASALKQMRIKLGQGVAGSVAVSGQSLVIDDAYADPRFDPSFDQRTGFQTRNLLTVPIKTRDAVVGVIQVINKCGGAGFGETDVRVMETLAAQAGASLQNARLFEDTRKLADDLRESLEAERRLSIEKAKMGAYLPKQVVDDISRSREETLALGGRTITASMLFSDIKGFTALSESLDPQEIVAWLNTYMTAMTEVIEEHGGIIDKFMGDGIMAIFTSDDGDDREHAERSSRAGLAMQQRLQTLREQNADVAHLSMRVGINTGEVVAGNIGSQTRMDYTVIGDNVNVASRIEGIAEPGSVTVSESTWEYIAAKFSAREREPIQVKNRQRPVKTYQLEAAPQA